MASNQVDSLQSFTHLIDNIPQWLTQLDDLVTKCEIQFERFTRITQHGEVKLTRKKKHASTESLRPGENTNTAAALQHDTGGADIIPSAPALISTTEVPTACNIMANQEIRRKRRAGSDFSGEPSSQCRYRMKNMVVVYYDSEIQEALEALVKNIATARNTLRKGRHTATFKSRIKSMGTPPPPIGKPHDRTDGLVLDPKLLLEPGLARTRLGNKGKNEMQCFEDADRDLEQAQNLCEKAAHQFLRDGDCHAEIEGTRERFINCEEIAKGEAEKLRVQERVAKAQEKELEETRALLGELTPPDNLQKENPIMIDVAAKIGPAPLTMNFAGTGAIEIDDASDAESLHIDMNAIRRTVRSTRV